MTTFEFEKHIKVTTLDIKWDIFWVMGDEDDTMMMVLLDVNDSLTRAAISAIESKNYNIWFDVADAFGNFGASDSEPIWQFRDLWKIVYGEDVW